MFYYPYGYCGRIICPECGEDTVLLGDDDYGEIHVCPECGEEIYPSKELSTVVGKPVIIA